MLDDEHGINNHMWCGESHDHLPHYWEDNDGVEWWCE